MSNDVRDAKILTAAIKYADKKIAELTERIEKVEKTVEIIDKEALKKMMVTISPVAKAVKELQEAIGVSWCVWSCGKFFQHIRSLIIWQL